MSIEKPVSFVLPEELAKQIGEKAKAQRLSMNLTRKTLAQRSGVPEPTLRRFESTGLVGFVALLQIADALGCMDDFNSLFSVKPSLTLDEFLAPQRKRGRK